MKTINLNELKRAMSDTVKSINFDSKKELVDFIDVEVVQTFERGAAEECNVSYLESIENCIENINDFRDCINDFIEKQSQLLNLK